MLTKVNWFGKKYFNQSVIKKEKNIHMICSICVNKRPVLLKKLLLSFEEQELPQNTELEIIIVDNGPKQLGKKVAEEFKRRNNLKINYFVQPIKHKPV